MYPYMIHLQHIVIRPSTIFFSQMSRTELKVMKKKRKKEGKIRFLSLSVQFVMPLPLYLVHNVLIVGICSTGNMSLRLCTAAEAKFYFNNFVGGGSGVLPNKNCNLTSWVPGCEPGWACSLNPTVQVSLNESEDIPSRTFDCQACCEGFFCPEGLTCMIREY